MGLCFCTPIIYSPQLSIVLSWQSLYYVNLWVLVRQTRAQVSSLSLPSCVTQDSGPDFSETDFSHSGAKLIAMKHLAWEGGVARGRHRCFWWEGSRLSIDSESHQSW